jgi:hypothetical protein
MPIDTETGNIRYISSNIVPVINDPTQENEPVEAEPETEEIPEEDKQIDTKKEEFFYKKLKKFLYDQRTIILKRMNTIKEIKLFETKDILSVVDIVEDEKKKMIKQFIPIYKELLPNANKDFILNRMKVLITLNDLIFEKIEEVILLNAEPEPDIDYIISKIKSVYNFATSKAKVISKTEVKGI